MIWSIGNVVLQSVLEVTVEVTFQMKALCCVLAQEQLGTACVMNKWKNWMPSDTYMNVL